MGKNSYSLKLSRNKFRQLKHQGMGNKHGGYRIFKRNRKRLLKQEQYIW